MKKILSMIVAVTLIAMLVGCSNQPKEEAGAYVAPTEAITNNSTVETVSVETTTENAITTISSTEQYKIVSVERAFSNGVAWVMISQDTSTKKKLALINTNGEILYIQKNEERSPEVTTFFHNLSAVYYNGKPGFTIVNTNGDVFYSNTDENTFLYGIDVDGNFYFAKHDSGFDHDLWHLNVIGAERSVTDLNIDIPEPSLIRVNDTIRITDELIYFIDSYGYLNLKKNCYIQCGLEQLSTALSNSNTILIDDSGEYFLVSKELLSDITTKQEIRDLISKGCSVGVRTIRQKNDVLLTNDIESLYWEYSSWKDGSFFRRYTINKKTYRDYVDTNGNKIFSFPTFADGVEYKEIDSASANLFAVYLKGVDKKQYATIVDDNGKTLYDPVLLNGDDHCSCNGYIFAYTSSDKPYIIISPEGKQKKIGDDLSGLEDARVTNKNLYVGGGYIFFREGNEYYKYISVDGSHQVESVKANYNSKGELVYTDSDGVLHVNSNKESNNTSVKETEPSTEITDEPTTSPKTYIKKSDFSIVGKWKNVGNYTFGQAQKGSIISFDGKNCNLFSPNDTYAFYKDGDDFSLDCTSPLADTVSFAVKIVDENHIDIYNVNGIIELKKVE